MKQPTSRALIDLIERYCEYWKQQTGHWPKDNGLLGLPSPCVVEEDPYCLYWQPQPFTLPASLAGVERGVEIRLQPSVIDFYTTQFAGDLKVNWQTQSLTLLQVWSEEDFQQLQQNLIGHLVMKRRLKQSPTVFIGTTDQESEVLAVDNLSGEVIIEVPGARQRQVLASSLPEFLAALTPRIE